MKPSLPPIDLGSFYLSRLLKPLLFLIYISICFPAVSFSLVPGETSIFPLLFSILYLAICRKRITRKDLALFSVPLFVGLILSFFYSVPVDALTKTSVSFIQLAIVYALFKSIKVPTHVKYLLATSRYVLFFHLFVGFLQFVNLGFIIAPVSRIAISRFYETSLSGSGRGVAFLTNEPSHALIGVVLPIFILYVFGNARDKLLSTLIFFATVILSSGGTSYAFLALCIVTYVVFLGVKMMARLFYFQRFRWAPISVLFLVFIFLGVFYQSLVAYSPRMAELLSSLIYNPQYLIILSGFRFASIISVFSSLSSFPLCMGFGSWWVSSLDLLYQSGYDVSTLGHFKYTGIITPIRPLGWVPNLIIDFWWLGVFFAVYLMYYLWQDSADLFRFFFNRLIPLSFLVALFLCAALFWPFGASAPVAIIGILGNASCRPLLGRVVDKVELPGAVS